MCNSTAGEEEFNTKRLSYLHSVGSDFASLIYELPDDADFDKFDEKCKKVEDLIKGSSKLMDSLVSSYLVEIVIALKEMYLIFIGRMQQTP